MNQKNKNNNSPFTEKPFSGNVWESAYERFGRPFEEKSFNNKVNKKDSEKNDNITLSPLTDAEKKQKEKYEQIKNSLYRKSARDQEKEAYLKALAQKRAENPPKPRPKTIGEITLQNNTYHAAKQQPEEQENDTSVYDAVSEDIDRVKKFFEDPEKATRAFINNVKSEFKTIFHGTKNKKEVGMIQKFITFLAVLIAILCFLGGLVANM